MEMATHLKALIMASIGLGGTAAWILLVWRYSTPEQFRRWTRDRVMMLVVVVTWGAGYLAVEHPRQLLNFDPATLGRLVLILGVGPMLLIFAFVWFAKNMLSRETSRYLSAQFYPTSAE